MLVSKVHLHLEECTKEAMEIIKHYSDKQNLKQLVIVHMLSVGTMTELCIFSSVWWEEFKWGWLMFLTYVKSWNNALRKEIFLVEWNLAFFSEDTSISLHFVNYQSLVLQGFLAASSLTRPCDIRLLGQTSLAIKNWEWQQIKCYLSSLVRDFDVRFPVAKWVCHSGSEWILGLSDYRCCQP